jgi:hypothetical protein
MKKQYYLIYLAILFLFNSCVSPIERIEYEDEPTIGSTPSDLEPSSAGEMRPIKQRFALLIGNQGYKKGGLETPHNDVDDMAKSLEAVGFKVRTLKDQNLWEMKQAILGLGELLKQNEDTVGLFYFSGHGMQYEGENFLFPIGAMLLR